MKCDSNWNVALCTAKENNTEIKGMTLILKGGAYFLH